MEELSSDDLHHIFHFFDLKNKIKCRSVCRTWKIMLDQELQNTKVAELSPQKFTKSWSGCSSPDHDSSNFRCVKPSTSFAHLTIAIRTVLNNLTCLKLYKSEVHWLDLVKLSSARAWTSGNIDHVEFCHSYFILRNYFNEGSVSQLMKGRKRKIVHLVFIGNNEMGTYTVYQGQTELLFKKLVEESKEELEELICDDTPGLDSFIDSLHCDNLKKIEKHSASGLITSVSATYKAKGNELEQVQIV